jgi:hypothetical protein
VAASEVLVVLRVVVPDGVPDAATRIADLAGRELPQVPGSWVSKVAVHPYPLGVTIRAAAEAGAEAAGRSAGRGLDRGLGELTGDGLSGDELDAETDDDFGASDHGDG